MHTQTLKKITGNIAFHLTAELESSQKISEMLACTSAALLRGLQYTTHNTLRL